MKFARLISFLSVKTLLLMLSIGVLFGGAVLIANGPDRELHFYRETTSSSSLPILSGALQNSALWPKWFYSLEKVTALAPNGEILPSPSPVITGSTLRLWLNDHKSPWSAMQITVQVLESHPQHIKLRVIEDSKGKLTRLFDHLEWEVQFKPSNLITAEPRTTQITARAVAHTRHWRSRLFGALTEKILMNQVFHPNILQLAQLRSLAPLSPNEKNSPPSLSSSDALLSLPSSR